MDTLFSPSLANEWVEINIRDRESEVDTLFRDYQTPLDGFGEGGPFFSGVVTGREVKITVRISGDTRIVEIFKPRWPDSVTLKEYINPAYYGEPRDRLPVSALIFLIEILQKILSQPELAGADWSQLFTAADSNRALLRKAMVERLQSPAMLEEIAKGDPRYEVREAATCRISNQDLLYEIAVEDPSLRVSVAALHGLTERSLLRDIVAQYETANSRRVAALCRLRDVVSHSNLVADGPGNYSCHESC